MEDLGIEAADPVEIARLEKLEELAEIAASLPPGLGEAALVSLAENAAEVFEACGADDVSGRAPLGSWAESVQAEWEKDGGLWRDKDHPDSRWAGRFTTSGQRATPIVSPSRCMGKPWLG